MTFKDLGKMLEAERFPSPDRYVNETSKRRACPKADAFLSEIEEVCRKHGLSISHEDGHGGFIVSFFDEDTMRWLNDTSVEEEAIETNGKEKT